MCRAGSMEESSARTAGTSMENKSLLCFVYFKYLRLFDSLGLMFCLLQLSTLGYLTMHLGGMH